MTFADRGVKWVPKMKALFSRMSSKWKHFLTRLPHRGHSWALERSRVQKLLPNGASGNSKTVQNRGFWEEHLIDPEDVFPCANALLST